MSSCKDPQRIATVEGTPRLKSVPSLKVVTVATYDGGLRVFYSFRHRLVLAPAGVLVAWRVFVYRDRQAAKNPAAGLSLTVEDRGTGWEPSGWTITTAEGTTLGQVNGNVGINKARDRLSVFYPRESGDLRTPFYWYANEWEIRAFVPTKNPDKPDYAVNGSVSFDCPAGTDKSGTPNPKLLLRDPLIITKGK